MEKRDVWLVKNPRGLIELQRGWSDLHWAAVQRMFPQTEEAWMDGEVFPL